MSHVIFSNIVFLIFREKNSHFIFLGDEEKPCNYTDFVWKKKLLMLAFLTRIVTKQ